MIGKIRFLSFIILSIFLAASRLVAQQNAAEDRFGISPLFEQMLAHEIRLLWEELVKDEKIRPGQTFFLAGLKKEDKALASDVVSYLKQNVGSIAGNHVEFLNGAKEPFYGVMLVEFESLSTIEEAGSYLTGSQISDGYLIVFLPEYVNRGWLESNIEEMGLQIRSYMAPRELEYIEGDSGRQIVDLNNPYYRNQLYERLVRDGENPVRAAPEADAAIRRFRSFQEPMILVLRKA